MRKPAPRRIATLVLTVAAAGAFTLAGPSAHAAKSTEWDLKGGKSTEWDLKGGKSTEWDLRSTEWD